MLRTEQIRREAKRLERKIRSQPRIWRFRGRRVVHANEWKWADWSKFPDAYFGPMIHEKVAPADCYRDYLALMEALKDPLYGKMRCWVCAIDQAQDAKKELDRHERYWQENGGEAAKERWYQEVGEPHATIFRKQDAMREVEWRIFNELAGAQNCTCDIMNYFKCPYGDEWRQLQEDGYDAYRLWREIEWYDHHWNLSTTHTPSPSELKWYHWNEPAIIDVTSYDDIVRSIDDGRLDRIIDEHIRYMKETNREIWNL